MLNGSIVDMWQTVYHNIIKLQCFIFLLLTAFSRNLIYSSISFFVGFLLLSSLTTMTFPYFMGKLIDSAKSANALSWMNNTNTMALLLIGILLVQSIMSFFRVYLFATASERAMADVRMSFFDKMLTLGLPFYEQRRVGELTSRSANDVDQLQDMLSATLPEFVRQLVTIVFGISFIFYQ